MPTWLTVVLLLLAVFTLAAVWERWRLVSLERWSQKHGFRVHTPFVPGDRPPVDRLAKRFDIRGGRIWGAALDGPFDGVATTLAEHETSPPGKQSGVWEVLVAWPISGPKSPLVLWPGGGTTLLGLPLSEMRLADRLGAGDAEAASLRTVTDRGLVIEGDPAVRLEWLTDRRREALESWRHGGAFVVEADFAAWRVPGLLSTSRIDDLRRQFPEVRRILE